MSLFRSEAIETQRKRLYGDVTIHQPLSFRILTLSVVIGTIATGIGLANGRYAQKEEVSGWIAPQAGLAQVYAMRGGVATQVNVRVGDHVRAGAPLAILSTDVSGLQGGLAVQERAQIESRISEIDMQVAEFALRQRTEIEKQNAQITELREEATRLNAELSDAQQLLQIAKKQLDDVEPLVPQGVVAAEEQDKRAAAVLADDQSVVALRRELDGKRSDLGAAQLEMTAMQASAAVEASQLRASRSTLVQNLNDPSMQEVLMLRSPIDGWIAASNLDVGDSPTATSPLFAIAPSGSALQAEILAPGRAIGFVATGQQVNIHLDAFPSQQFGTVKATVATVSRAPLTPGQIVLPIDFKEPVYRLTARLDTKPQILAALRPGMTFKGYIITSRRTFAQWLFEPIILARQMSR